MSRQSSITVDKLVLLCPRDHKKFDSKNFSTVLIMKSNRFKMQPRNQYVLNSFNTKQVDLKMILFAFFPYKRD